MIENNYFFIKKYISKHSKKKDVIVIFVLLEETENFNLFDINCTQEKAKCYNSI